MRIALVQQHATLDRDDNLRRGLAALETAAGAGAELVCYAELAFEPFYPQRPAGEDPMSLAEEVPGPVTNAFAARAAELGVVVVLNLFERAGDRCFDCSPVIDRSLKPRPAGSASPSATTATTPSTCAPSRSQVRKSLSCRRRARSANGRTGCTRRSYGWRPSKTATSPRCATALVLRNASTSRASPSSADSLRRHRPR